MKDETNAFSLHKRKTKLSTMTIAHKIVPLVAAAATLEVQL